MALTRNETPTGSVRDTPIIRERVTVDAPARSYLSTPPEQWSWSQLRDYVFYEIESRGYPIPERNPLKEASIFRRFVKDVDNGGWGEFAGPIAKYAFEVYDGFWCGAPISPTRFSKNSDPFFAEVILDQLINSERM